ncbi:polysaccharide deacetylase family protein [Plantactinospora sp. CA-290183]|uniref:polysaccharide deacetylase family protein n=1 Tax=Plantactinospora sp. CA-290183 TaxID=3240006 RepID=UPI003D94B158
MAKTVRISLLALSAGALAGALVLGVVVVRAGSAPDDRSPQPDPAAVWATPSPVGDVRVTAAPGGSATPGGVTGSAATPSPGRPAPADRPGATRVGTRPPVVDHGPRTGDRVALTFDADMTDGMLANLRAGRVRSYANLRIIELLERERVPATFFLTGKWVERYPALTRRLAGNPGFELANHTYGHLAFTPDCHGLPRLPGHRMTEDVARTFQVVEPYGGRQTRYFRFPGLCHDAAALAALAPLGLTVVDGDVVSGDPFATAWRPIVDAVLSKVRPGSVVILHVTEANAAMTDEALPHILRGLRERGLTPAPLSEVLGR